MGYRIRCILRHQALSEAFEGSGVALQPWMTMSMVDSWLT